jgi:hypothetical protein
MITRSHLDLKDYKYFNPDVDFSQDISHLLPPREKCWWEDLGE